MMTINYLLKMLFYYVLFDGPDKHVDDGPDINEGQGINNGPGIDDDSCIDECSPSKC